SSHLSGDLNRRPGRVVAGGRDACSSLRRGASWLVQTRIACRPRGCGVRRAARAAVGLPGGWPPRKPRFDDIVGRRQLALVHPAIDRARADPFPLGDIGFGQPLARATEHGGFERIKPQADGLEKEPAHAGRPSDVWTNANQLWAGKSAGGRHDLYRSCQLYFRGGRTWPIFLASEACFMSFPFGRATSRFIAPFFCSQCAISLFLALGRSRQYSAIAATTSSGNCASRWRVLAPAFRPNARRRFKNPSSVSCHTNGACITCVGGFVGGHVAETCSGRESCPSSATTGGRNTCSVAHAQNQSAVTCAAPRSHGESARRWQQAAAQFPRPSAPAPRRRRASRLHMRAGHRHRAPRPLRDRDTVRRYRWSRRRETTAFAPPVASRESPSRERRKLRRISPCGRPSCPVQKRRRR